MLTSSVLIPVGAIYPPIKTNWHSQQKPRTKNKKESLTEIIYQPRSNEDQNYDHGGGKKKTNLEQAMIKLLLDLHEGRADPSATGSEIQVLGSDRIELLAYAFDW